MTLLDTCLVMLGRKSNADRRKRKTYRVAPNAHQTLGAEVLSLAVAAPLELLDQYYATRCFRPNMQQPTMDVALYRHKTAKPVEKSEGLEWRKKIQ